MRTKTKMLAYHGNTFCKSLKLIFLKILMIKLPMLTGDTFLVEGYQSKNDELK